MEPIMTNQTRRVRLSNEELMAGKCFSELTAQEPETDPRFKSPDFILDRNPNSIIKNPNLDVTVRVATLEKQLSTLRQQHTSEIDEWKEYEKQVIEWKKQVLDIVQQLKSDAMEKYELLNEVRKCKAQIEHLKNFVQ